jgi:hypothetical protein
MPERREQGHTAAATIIADRSVRLDRLPSVDPRRADHPATAAITRFRALPLKSRRRPVRHQRDQGTYDCPTCGQGGACGGYSGCDVAEAWLKIRALVNQDCHALYHEGQWGDEWAGDFRQYEGTSNDGVHKAMVARAWITRYVWADVDDPAQATADLARMIIYLGMPIAGTDWHEGMLQPDQDGYLHATGPTIGGHLYAISGYYHDPNPDRRSFLIYPNSWGGAGQGRLPWADMTGLLERGGDAAVGIAPGFNPAKINR